MIMIFPKTVARRVRRRRRRYGRRRKRKWFIDFWLLNRAVHTYQWQFTIFFSFSLFLNGLYVYMGHVFNVERSLTGQITRNFYLTTPLYTMFYPAFIRSLLPYIWIFLLIVLANRSP